MNSPVIQEEEQEMDVNDDVNEEVETVPPNAISKKRTNASADIPSSKKAKQTKVEDSRVLKKLIFRYWNKCNRRCV